jgi:formylglycine-generating enzyme
MFRHLITILSTLWLVVLVVSVQADVFNMGGTRDPLTGKWTGLASLETVTVGNSGNAADNRVYNPSGNLGCGAVGYNFQIGKFEVTAGQYCEFLNAVAKTDPYYLYTPLMDSDVNKDYWGCNIKRSGVSGSYVYNVASDWANRPVNWVSWGDAARFVNWLQNGQPTGRLTGIPSSDLGLTEDGTYFLNGATGWSLATVTRKSGATWVIPTLDEWYKAAYHKNNGVTGNYWCYPTKSDSAPINTVEDPDPGNHANFYDSKNTGTGDFTIGTPYVRTPVGEFENSASPYGTFDQGGNALEWSEGNIFGSRLYEWYRVLCGGDFQNSVVNLRFDASWYYDDSFFASNENAQIGFRVVSIVPEPSTLALIGIGAISLLGYIWQRRKHKV